MDDYIREEEELKKQRMREMEGLGEWEELEEGDEIEASIGEPAGKNLVVENSQGQVFEGVGAESAIQDQVPDSEAESNPASSVASSTKPPASELPAEPEGSEQPPETSSSNPASREVGPSDSSSVVSPLERTPLATPPASHTPGSDSDFPIPSESFVEAESSLVFSSNESSSITKNSSDQPTHVVPSTPPPSTKPPTSTSTSTSISAPDSSDNESNSMTIPVEMRPHVQVVFEALPANFTQDQGSINLNSSSSAFSKLSESTSSSEKYISIPVSSGSSASAPAVPSSSSVASVPESSKAPNHPPPLPNSTPAGASGGGGSESIYRTISKRLNALETNATLSLQYMEHGSQTLRDVFARMEKRQEEKMGEMLRALNGSNWRQIEALVSASIRDVDDKLVKLLTYPSLLLSSSPLAETKTACGSSESTV